ncbi:unnamed protein product, partial [Heterosigma akashiwo]
SGAPVSCYGLGGAARSTQPSSLPSLYFDEIQGQQDKAELEKIAPFYFYYNPHRYPQFMSGIRQVCSDETREDIFVASGGTDRSIAGLDQRLSDCLDYCGGKYLDAFILEYVCPYELDDEIMYPGPELAASLKHTQEWVNQGTVRYVGISTHSHMVGKALARSPEVDILMLRYGMSHKDAAERLSFPAARENGKAVIAFTSTRWNRLQEGIQNNSQWNKDFAPTSADCLSFVFGSKASPPVEAVLHSARDEDELLCSLSEFKMLSLDEENKWRDYGKIFEELNEDNFDEYPEERSI